MVGLVCLFPYARPEGIGGLFARYAHGRYVWLALLEGLIVLFFLYRPGIIIAILTWLIVYYLATRVQRQLGGLTGDVYGALTETGIMLFLLLSYLSAQVGCGAAPVRPLRIERCKQRRTIAQDFEQACAGAAGFRRRIAGVR